MPNLTVKPLPWYNLAAIVDV